MSASKAINPTMKDILIGFVLGYWLKDKIDPDKIEPEAKTLLDTKRTTENDGSNHLSTGLWLAGISLGIGLLTLLIGWYLLTFICVFSFFGGIGMVLSREQHR